MTLRIIPRPLGSGAVTIAGQPIGVAVSNFPATQPIAGNVGLFDEQGNKAQITDWHALWQLILRELIAIRVGMQYLVTEMDATKGLGGIDLKETAEDILSEEAN